MELLSAQVRTYLWRRGEMMHWKLCAIRGHRLSVTSICGRCLFCPFPAHEFATRSAHTHLLPTTSLKRAAGQLQTSLSSLVSAPSTCVGTSHDLDDLIERARGAQGKCVLITCPIRGGQHDAMKINFTLLHARSASQDKHRLSVGCVCFRQRWTSPMI